MSLSGLLIMLAVAIVGAGWGEGSRINMSWFFLTLAGLCEIIWATGLKKYGFTLTWGGAMTVGMMLLSFVFLQQAMKELPLGTAYAIWTGIGAVGAVVVGMVWMNESRDLLRIICIVLIVIGIVGLKFLTPTAS
jgi:quaternary ammonium compound-resistance protein SugE